MNHMKVDAQYRTNDYFNAVDYYIVETNLSKLLVTRLEQYNGSWFTVAGMQYKASSVRMVKLSKIKVERDGILGRIVKGLEPSDVGVIWNQGQKHRHYYWNDINKLK